MHPDLNIPEVHKEAYSKEGAGEMNAPPVLQTIPISKIIPFAGHPYQVRDDAEMDLLEASVRANGILSPLILRPLEGGEYELISGHRRFRAAQKAGIPEVPAFVYSVARDEAAIMLVDSNLHREHMLPSEKAYAYRLKAEAMKHYGRANPGLLVPDYDATRTTAVIGRQSNESYKTVQRYIRLTFLIEPILKMVDEGRIAFTPAVELSFLRPQEQQDLLDTMRSEDSTPSLSQARQMHQLSRLDKLSMDVIFSIMTTPKANQKEKISFDYKALRKYFPKAFSPADIQREVMNLLEKNYKRSRGLDR